MPNQPKLTPADELWFLGFYLPAAELFVLRALEAALPLMRASSSHNEEVDVDFRDGADPRDRVHVTVVVTDHEVAEAVLDELRKGLVSFVRSAPADLPNRVVGIVLGRECLRIVLNETGKLQIEISEEVAHMP
jgi:hypothetical protein